MDTPSFALLDYVSSGSVAWEEEVGSARVELRLTAPAAPPLDAETLRRCAWEIGEKRPAEAYLPEDNHIALGSVSPKHGFVHWRIRQEWVDETARRRGAAWNNCRLVLRLYDVSYIHFTGFNAHRIQDESLPSLCGQRFFHLPRSGTAQLGEVGFVLRSGEFLPAARSHAVQFARDSWSSQRDQTALYVDDRWRIETVGNVWEQENFLRERRRPKLRHPLRIAAFALNGEDGLPAPFVRELTLQEHTLGHEVHVFVPVSESLSQPLALDGVHYHPLPIVANGSPLETAQAFARAVEVAFARRARLRSASSSRMADRLGGGSAASSARAVADFLGGDAAQWNAAHRSLAGHPRVRALHRSRRPLRLDAGLAARAGHHRTGHGRRAHPLLPHGRPSRQRVGMSSRLWTD